MERPAGVEPVLSGLEGQGPTDRPRPLGKFGYGSTTRVLKGIALHEDHSSSAKPTPDVPESATDRHREGSVGQRRMGAGDGDRTHDIQLGKLTLYR